MEDPEKDTQIHPVIYGSATDPLESGRRRARGIPISESVREKASLPSSLQIEIRTVLFSKIRFLVSLFRSIRDRGLLSDWIRKLGNLRGFRRLVVFVLRFARDFLPILVSPPFLRGIYRV